MSYSSIYAIQTKVWLKMQTEYWRYYAKSEKSFVHCFDWGDLDIKQRTGHYFRTYVAKLRQAHSDAGVAFDFDEILEREGMDGQLPRSLWEHVGTLRRDRNKQLFRVLKEGKLI